MAAMVQISRELGKEGYPRSMGQANIEYLHRRDRDLRFRELSSAGKGLSGFRDFPHKEQSYALDSPPAATNPPRSIEENAKVYETELSL